MIIRNIVENKITETEHNKFVRFSKGVFEDRFIVNIKLGRTLKIKASYDMSNDLFELIARNIDAKADVSGIILSAEKLDLEADVRKKGRMLLYTFNNSLGPEELNRIYDKAKDAFILLDISSDNFKLKCKQSLPKPGSSLKDNFCSAELPVNLLKELAFDFDEKFTNARIRHNIIIDDIIMPSECKDPALERKQSKRKGRIVRIITFEREIKKEYPFLV
jgi:hypothetical protein